MVPFSGVGVCAYLKAQAYRVLRISERPWLYWFARTLGPGARGGAGIGGTGGGSNRPVERQVLQALDASDLLLPAAPWD